MNDGPVNMPYGDAFIVQTPTLDRVSQQLMQANLDRQKYARDESQRVDGLLNKELANVRSVDMPQVMDAYQQWSQLSKRSLFDKSVQNNPKLYNALQVEKNAAMGNVLGKINESSRYNQEMKDLATERKSKPNLYGDDFGDKMAALVNTPMDQLQNHPKYGDLTNVDNYRYKGAQTDFGKIEATAAGALKPTGEKTERLNDLQTRRTPIQFGNTPLQFFDNLKGQLSQRIPGRDASAAWENIPDAQKAGVDQAYSQISPDKWKQWTGDEKPQVIAPTDPSNPAENYAAYRAKIYAINATAKLGTSKDETNLQAKMNLQFDHQKTMEAIRQGGKVQLKELGHAYKQMDKKEQDSKLDEIYDGMIEGSKEEKDKEGNVKPIPPKFYKSADGQIRKQWELKSSAFIKDELALPNAKGHKIPPDKVMLEENGDILPIYYERGEDENGNEVIKKDKNGSYAVDMEKSRPVTQGEIKAVIGKKLVGVKEANRSTTPGAQAPSASPTTTVPAKTKLPKNAFD